LRSVSSPRVLQVLTVAIVIALASFATGYITSPGKVSTVTETTTVTRTMVSTTTDTTTVTAMSPSPTTITTILPTTVPTATTTTVPTTVTTMVPTTVTTTVTTTITIVESMPVEYVEINADASAICGGGWRIRLVVFNFGVVNVTIDNIFINGKPWSSYSGITISTPPPILVMTYSSVEIYITIPGNTGFVSGQMIEVKLHTTDGKEYSKQVTLLATENVQIVSAHATGSQGNWTIIMEVRNVGTTDVVIDNIFINGMPYSQVAGVSLGSGTQLPMLIPCGGDKTITILISGSSFSSGQMIEVKLHTASGKEYPKLITLP